VVVHASALGHNVTLNEGGGGVSCSSIFLPVLLAPPYGDFEDNTIGGQPHDHRLAILLAGRFP
jgi:hypothetical protein